MALGIVVSAPSRGTSAGAVPIVRPNVVFDVPKSSPQADIAVPKRSVRLPTFGMTIQRFQARGKPTQIVDGRAESLPEGEGGRERSERTGGDTFAAGNPTPAHYVRRPSPFR